MPDQGTRFVELLEPVPSSAPGKNRLAPGLRDIRGKPVGLRVFDEVFEVVMQRVEARLYEEYEAPRVEKMIVGSGASKRLVDGKPVRPLMPTTPSEREHYIRSMDEFCKEVDWAILGIAM